MSTDRQYPGFINPPTSFATTTGLRPKAERRLERRRRSPRSVRFLRVMAVAEATAFLLLLTAGTYNEITGHLHWAFFLMGNVHGAIFTTYMISIFVLRARVGWGPVMLLLVVLAGFVPGGGLMVERWALMSPDDRPDAWRRASATTR